MASRVYTIIRLQRTRTPTDKSTAEGTVVVAGVRGVGVGVGWTARVCVVVSLDCSGGGGAVCTRRGDGPPPPPRGWTLVSILVAVVAQRAAGVRLCGRARQRCNPCTHPLRRRRYSCTSVSTATTVAFRPSEWVRACAVPMWARPATTDSSRRAAPRSPGENPRILRSNAHALGSRAPPLHIYRDCDALRIPVTGAPVPRRRRLTALAHTYTHIHLQTIHSKSIYSCGAAFV